MVNSTSKTINGQRILVAGGSRGLGLGMVEAFVDRGAIVSVIARGETDLLAVRNRLGVSIIQGDAADPVFVKKTLKDQEPSIVILNAGAVPPMAPIHKISWEDFTQVWDCDVKSTLYWIQAAIKQPLSSGSRVLIGSSGAALNGSPLSGGYAGAKRMQWIMANYANDVSKELGLGIRFQTLVPSQMVAGTGVGTAGSTAYARAKNITPEAFLASSGKPMTPRNYGDYIARILEDSQWDDGVAFSIRSEQNIVKLEKRS